MEGGEGDNVHAKVHIHSHELDLFSLKGLMRTA